MEENILKTIKLSLGIQEEDNSFNQEILTHINGSVLSLYQVGVVKDIDISEDTNWNDIIPEGLSRNNFIKYTIPRYIFIDTKLLFDPPTAATASAFHNKLKEMLWRFEVISREE